MYGVRLLEVVYRVKLNISRQRISVIEFDFILWFV